MTQNGTEDGENLLRETEKLVGLLLLNFIQIKSLNRPT